MEPQRTTKSASSSKRSTTSKKGRPHSSASRPKLPRGAIELRPIVARRGKGEDDSVLIAGPRLEDMYVYRVLWSEPDKEFVGLCDEFPSLSWLDPDKEKAHTGIRALVSDVLADMRRTRE